MIAMRKASLSDGANLLSWRNDKLVRETSFSKDEISLEEHRAWLSNVINNKNQLLLIAENNEGSLGVVRFDFEGEEAARVSIYLNPNFIGLGLGYEVLSAGVDFLKQSEYAHINKIIADVMSENDRSHQFFKRMGFIEKYTCYEKNI